MKSEIGDGARADSSPSFRRPPAAVRRRIPRPRDAGPADWRDGSRSTCRAASTIGPLGGLSHARTSIVTNRPRAGWLAVQRGPARIAILCGDMVKWLSSLLLACFVACLPPAQAAGDVDRLVIGSETGPQDTWQHTTVLDTGDVPADISFALDHVGDFHRPTVPAGNFGAQHRPVWLRIPIRVGLTDDWHWMLELAYAPLHRADLYVVQDRSVLHYHRLGAAQRFIARPMPTRTHVANLTLQPGQRYELYIRLQTPTSMIAPIRLLRPDQYLVVENRMQILEGLALGAALVLLGYSIVHWIALRSTAYLYYAVTLIGTNGFFVVYTGLGQQYLWPQTSSTFVDNLAPLSVLLALSSGPLFAASTLETGAHSPYLDRGLKITSLLAVVNLLLEALGLLDYRQIQSVATVLGPTVIALALPAAWRLARKGEPIGTYMLTG